MGQLVWAAAPEAGALKRWFRHLRGPAYKKKMEMACIEGAALIENYAKAIVHVQTGRLRGSISSELRDRGVRAVAVVGSPLAYAPIEEVRGLDRPWGMISVLDASMGEHSFIAKAFVAKSAEVLEIFKRHIGDT